MRIGITNIHIQNNELEYINKLSFISVLWIYSCNELKWWQNYYFSTIIISNSLIEILVSYSWSTYVNVNMSFPNSKFGGNFSTYVFGKSFWHYRELKSTSYLSRKKNKVRCLRPLLYCVHCHSIATIKACVLTHWPLLTRFIATLPEFMSRSTSEKAQ